MSDPIRILMAEDHAIVSEGLRALIATEPHMELVGEARDGEVAVRLYEALQPDVMLVDLKMPRKDGVAVIGEIKQHHPEARLLVFTSFAEEAQILAAIKAGAVGYVLKDSSPQELLQAIRDVYVGKSSLSPAIARTVLRELQPAPLRLGEEPLSAREVDVLVLLAEGLTNQEIAERLMLSERTVGNHVGSILTKLHLANRTQAALYALRKGLARLDEVQSG